MRPAKKARRLADQGKSSFMAELKFKLVDKIVFQKIRDLFGGKAPRLHDRQRGHEPRYLQILLRHRHSSLRCLRHDRNHPGHYHELPRQLQDRERGPGDGQDQGGHRPVRGRAGCQRRRDHLLRPQCHEGLPQQARSDQRDHDPGRRREDRRPRPHRRRRVPVDHGPHQGAVQARKRQVCLPRSTGGGYLPEPLRAERPDLRRQQGLTMSA